MSGVFIVDFEQILHIVQVFPLLAGNIEGKILQQTYHFPTQINNNCHDCNR